MALTGRAGQGVVGYRSEFLHLWVFEAAGAALDEPAVAGSLADLEREALRLPAGVIPPPGLLLPVEVHYAFAGLQFLKEHLWEGRVEFCGLLLHGGRVWALRSGIDVALEQLTGAPARWRWHEWEGGAPLAWTEIGAAEVWRLGHVHERGALHAHYRPALLALPHAPAEDADAFSAAARAQAEAAASAPVVDDAAEPASRQARRRRRRRAQAQLTLVTPPPVEAAPPPSAKPHVAPVVIKMDPRLEAALTAPAHRPAPSPAPSPVPPPVPQVRVTTPKRAPARPPARRAPSLPRFAWPRGAALVRHPVTVAAAAAIVVSALVAAGVVARKPIAALVVGRYTLELTSSPAGARVRVDGKLEQGRTPLAIGLTPGEHRIDLNYGEYANAGFTIDGARGDLVRRDFAWTGSLGVASADSTVRLAVTLDGKDIGHAPLWRDSVPVGRHRLGFTAPGVRAWEEEVQVKSGQSARVSAVPVKVPNYGLVTARAELVSSDGVEDLDGIPVFVDGTRAGVTPLDLKLAPGPHSIRIARAEGAPSIHLIDVQPGGRFYASAEFGRPADPMVAFDPPAALSRATPPALAIRLVADLPLPVRQASVYLRADGDAFTRLPVAWSQATGQGAFTFPLDRLVGAKTATYYVEIETREGEEYFSELHTLPIKP